MFGDNYRHWLEYETEMYIIIIILLAEILGSSGYGKYMDIFIELS